MFTRRTFFMNAAAATLGVAAAAKARAAEHGHEEAPAHAAVEPKPETAKLMPANPPPKGAPAAAAKGGDVCEIYTPDLQKQTTPLQAIKYLKEGNARFLAGKPVNCNQLAAVEETSHGQAPFAVVVGCIDSRVPPEMVFDQQIGDIFCARIAGNFVNDDIVGSLEFATRVAGARAIVVLGHTSCGAIKGAIDGAKLGMLTKMLENFKPAIETCAYIEGERSSTNKPLVQAVSEANVLLAAMKITEKSDVIKQLIVQRQLIIAPAMHDIYTGQVTWLS